MKKTIAVILSIIIALIFIIPTAGCGNNNEEIRNLMTEFEYSCNTLDVDGILDCIHPDITNKVKVAMGIYGMFSGSDSSDMLDGLASIIVNNGKVNAEAFFKSIKIDINEINSSGSDAKVNIDLSYRLGTENITSKAELGCIKQDDKWYINKFSL